MEDLGLKPKYNSIFSSYLLEWLNFINFVWLNIQFNLFPWAPDFISNCLFDIST